MSLDLIRERLSAHRDIRERGDVVTGQTLLAEEDLIEFEDKGYGPIPSSGIPYRRGAGAPGVKTKRVPAGVLVPLLDRSGDLSVVLTRRTDGLAKHAGQVAFPGGRLEAQDQDVIDAALREAHEEVGIEPHTVDVLGCLDPYLTITGFEVVPVVGFVLPPPEQFVPEPEEVAEVFEVPLSFLLDRANHQKVRRVVNGMDRAYYAMPFESYYIWGATAGMIVNLAEMLDV